MWLAGVEQLVCVGNGAVALTAFPVPINIDTESSIASGALDPECADLRVTDRSGVALPFWVEDGTCDQPDTLVWVALDVPVGTTEVVVTAGPAPIGAPGDGHAVFPVFEDFADGTPFPSGWDLWGDGAWSIHDGLLDLTQPTFAMMSDAAAFTADDSVLVARLDAVGAYDDDVELGGGKFTQVDDNLWHGDRTWTGFSHVTYEQSMFTEGGCGYDQFPERFLPLPWEARAWHRFEVGYDAGGGSWIAREDGFGLDRSPPEPTCVVPSPQPALVVLDHADGGTNSDQRLDFVLVRPVTDPAPIVAVIAFDPDGDGVPSVQDGCGDDDADGVPNYDDPDPPPTAPPDETADTAAPSGDTAAPPEDTARPAPDTEVEPEGDTGEGVAWGDPAPPRNAGLPTASGCGCDAAPLGGLTLPLVATLFATRRRRR
ncbi:MAG: DUF2341 domain-containing protein [Myxococcota bacterium]